jgi:predicted NAD/FAD-dependent oxidoreductase
MKKVLIIGGGLAGCIAAKFLSDKGFVVQILEKSRGAGGRMATKRMEGSRADHGAQYFSARTEPFQDQVKEWLELDLIQAWRRNNDDEYNRYFCKLGMSSLPKSLLNDQIELISNERVTSWEKSANGYKTYTENGNSYFSDYLICTAPAPQAMDLLKASKDEEVTALKEITYEPCFALLLSTKEGIHLPENAALDKPNEIFNWLMSNTFKGFAAKPTYTLHTNHEFALEHFEKTEENIQKLLIERLPEQFKGAEFTEILVHKWRYGIAMKRIKEKFLKSSEGVYFGGDGFGIGNVEGAFLSGLAVAKDLAGNSL